MGILDRLTGRNAETLDSFLRRMLRDIMKQDPDSAMPGYLDAIACLPLDQLLCTLPATIITITEQYDQCRSQGMANDEALTLINCHRHAMLTIMGFAGSAAESATPASLEDFDESVTTTSLEDFIVNVVKREQPNTGPFAIDQHLVASLVAEARDFARKNPKHTMLAMQAELQERLHQ
jgi:hypothetical protein